eukprot:766147-Hanusia_phi.AAC.1
MASFPYNKFTLLVHFAQHEYVQHFIAERAASQQIRYGNIRSAQQGQSDTSLSDNSTTDIDAKFLRENEILELQHELKNSRHEEERLRNSISVSCKHFIDFILMVSRYKKAQFEAINNSFRHSGSPRYRIATSFEAFAAWIVTASELLNRSGPPLLTRYNNSTTWTTKRDVDDDDDDDDDDDTGNDDGDGVGGGDDGGDDDDGDGGGGDDDDRTMTTTTTTTTMVVVVVMMVVMMMMEVMMEVMMME